MEGDNINDGKKSNAGIPEAEFVDDVDMYMGKSENGGNAEKVLKRLDELHCKYKYMEFHLLAKKRRLQSQIPDLKRSLNMIEKLRHETEEFETEFLLSDQVFAKAVVTPTNTVCLWLGANVMLEYSLDDAETLLTKNIATATNSLEQVEQDVDFLRDQCTTTEVNMARVFNWDVKRRQAAKNK
ncbi:hypothetical protein PPYR_04141 [Photinus pyralis]|uniref:Prefoldin subunit 3 n=1 Tax=Photinus pyralis TaxID=7054 RepID=A0A1Y1NEA9_PHOPY|nr:prefoldin subunit 3-like [Photinus pyralis]XP_031334731.1 prefoldin subunit 3-like [Photinus pyralis]XP_031335317.1 prefoldin subunit 3-like [Photinus pyralis]XP_031351825.1 prefoldin subunit 3-like [Photinus pyralis]KAB0794738.1 hypothetical protein PPYR_11577 [Photinus pyralis]KAB0801822.1 hypothetical protein PPYR_04008 [Photinus pyralis]KAB0801955.1 hypothetical protein PPYR_04141 [Photinus pyralis]